MTKLFALFVVSFLGTSSIALAAEIKSGHYDLRKEVIELRVSYKGGCKEHSFDLEVMKCYPAEPRFCELNLIHEDQGDHCEDQIEERLYFNLADYGFDQPEYKGNYLVINGDGHSQAFIELP